MADRFGGLGTRFASAAVLAPLAVAATYAGDWIFAAFVGVAGALVVREWGRLVGNSGPALLVHGAIVIGGVFLAAARLELAALFVVVGAAAALALAAAVSRRDLGWTALGALYIGVPCIALIWLRAAPDTGFVAVLWVFAVVWATDIGAYLSGLTIGGPRLVPHLSPAKTWSGAAGGLLGAAVVGVIVASLTDVVLTRPTIGIAIGLSFLLSLSAQLGDLFESVIKRRFGAKDSGALIPGHGGVMDRVDSLLFAAPAAAGLALVRDDGILLWR